VVRFAEACRARVDRGAAARPPQRPDRRRARSDRAGRARDLAGRTGCGHDGPSRVPQHLPIRGGMPC
jgi:hypothetical protein